MRHTRKVRRQASDKSEPAPPLPAEERLLRVREVAVRLCLSKRAVHNLISRRVIPYIDLGFARKRIPRIRLSDLRELIRQRYQPPLVEGW